MFVEKSHDLGRAGRQRGKLNGPMRTFTDTRADAGYELLRQLDQENLPLRFTFRSKFRLRSDANGCLVQIWQSLARGVGQKASPRYTRARQNGALLPIKGSASGQASPEAAQTPRRAKSKRGISGHFWKRVAALSDFEPPAGFGSQSTAWLGAGVADTNWL